MTWIQTYTGRKFNLLNPRPEDVCLEDIAHHLSMLCRFNGATREHYSVAQHSVEVSTLLPPELKLIGLLHDAPEAYIGDMVRPVRALDKSTLYSALEYDIGRAVMQKFCIPQMTASDLWKLNEADDIMLATEARDLMAPPPDVWGLTRDPRQSAVKPWPQWMAKEMFTTAVTRLL